jgi:hypothetical protein
MTWKKIGLKGEGNLRREDSKGNNNGRERKRARERFTEEVVV